MCSCIASERSYSGSASGVTRRICGLAIALAVFPGLVVGLGIDAQARSQANEAEALTAQLTTLYQQGRYAEAIPLAQHLLAIREKSFGPNHVTVEASLNLLATLYYDQGRYAEAEPLYKRALTIAEKVY